MAAPATRHRSAAWPLALVWLALIVYASLHPFSGWRWDVLDAPQGWQRLLVLPGTPSSRFDLVSNVLAYIPLGLLLALAGLRGGRAMLPSALLALLGGSGLSLCMEMAQHLLPHRVPSRIDWGVNSGGTALGVLLALALQATGGVALWQRLRDAWLVPHAGAGLALLLAWPVGLLFPPPVPFAQGQGLARLSEWLDDALADTAFEGWAALPVAEGPLPPGLEVLTIALGLLAPCFVGYVMARRPGQRVVLLAGAIAIGAAATTLSTALNFGPEHATTWVTPTLRPGLVLAGLLGLGLALLPRRWTAALGLVALTALLALVNQIGADPYFAQSLAGWEQGRFIRFHGVAQWVGWLWPPAALAYLLTRTTAADTPGSPSLQSRP